MDSVVAAPVSEIVRIHGDLNSHEFSDGKIFVVARLNANLRMPVMQVRPVMRHQKTLGATAPAFWAARGRSGSCGVFTAFSRCFEKSEILFDVAIS